jgi:hypothetical protein
VNLKYLLDEHVAHALRDEILRQAPFLSVRVMGEPPAPPLGAPDPAILEWCEGHDYVFVTNNRRSMPSHLTDHVARGRVVPGIFVLKPTWGFGETAEHLAFVAQASLEGEYENQIRFLPLF